MERQRKYKLFSIIALMFAVIALSVGFAAFQKVLNISSSAAVKIFKDEEFKVNLYGIADEENLNKYLAVKDIDFLNLSKVSAIAVSRISNKIFFDVSSATINPQDLSINIDNILLKEPNDMAMFVFVLENESEFPVWVSVSDDSKTEAILADESYAWPVTCTKRDLTEPSNNVCDSIFSFIAFQDKNRFSLDLINGRIRLLAGDYVYFIYMLNFLEDAPLADEELLINIPQIKLEFSQ